MVIQGLEQKNNSCLFFFVPLSGHLELACLWPFSPHFLSHWVSNHFLPFSIGWHSIINWSSSIATFNIFGTFLLVATFKTSFQPRFSSSSHISFSKRSTNNKWQLHLRPLWFVCPWRIVWAAEKAIFLVCIGMHSRPRCYRLPLPAPYTLASPVFSTFPDASLCAHMERQVSNIVECVRDRDA